MANDDSYQRLEHDALVALAERTLTDPSSPREHKESAARRLAGGYVDMESQIRLIAERDPSALWALEQALMKIQATFDVPDDDA